MAHESLSIPLLVAGCGLLFFIGHGFEQVFRRYRVPDVLLLILLGLLIGPGIGWITPTGNSSIEHLFGHIALIVILFHGGLDLSLRDLRAHAFSAGRIAMGLLVATTVLVALLAHFAFGRPWSASWLIGLVLAPLAATVALPLLEHLPFSPQMRSIITIESALGDVAAIVAVLSLSQALVSREADIGLSIGRFVAALGGAAIIGSVAALLGSMVLSRLQALAKMGFASEAMLLVVAGLTEWMGFSGAIAALAYGIVFRNLDEIAPKLLPAQFKGLEGLTPNESALLHEAVFILKVTFFCYLGTLLGIHDLRILGAGLAAALLVMLLRVAWFRYAVGGGAEVRERLMGGVLCGRGLSSAVLAAIPLELGLPEGAWIRDVAFVVILISNILTGAGVILVARRRPLPVEGSGA
nr:cation:proton antiporter [uncultured Holophaga sp.]